MKIDGKITRRLAVAALFILFCAGTRAGDLTVASYNVRNRNSGDEKQGNGWTQRLPVICKIIQFHDFDIFGAQEVLHGQLNDMLALLPEYSCTGVGRDDGATAGEYVPIFYKASRFELLQSGNFWLAEDTSRPGKGWDAALPRLCTWGKFRDRQAGVSFWFFNLHMDHVGVEARSNSAALVLAKIEEMCGKEPVILTGDFNTDQNSPNYDILNGSGKVRDSYASAAVVYATNGTVNHFDTDKMTDSRIDHVFVSDCFSVGRYGVLTDTYRTPIEGSEIEIKSGNFPKEVSFYQYESRLPSDHFPVMVVLDYENVKRKNK